MNKERVKTKSSVSIQEQESIKPNMTSFHLAQVGEVPRKSKFQIFENELETEITRASDDVSRKRSKRNPLQEINPNRMAEKTSDPHPKAPSATSLQQLFKQMKVCSENIYGDTIEHKDVQTEWDSASFDRIMSQVLSGKKIETLIIRSSQLQYTKFKAKYSPSYKDAEELIPLEAYPFTEVSIHVAVALDNPLFRTGIIRLSRAAETIFQKASKGIEVFSVVSGSVEVKLRNMTFQLEEDDQFCIPQNECYALRNLEKTAESVCCFFLTKLAKEYS